MKKTIKIIIDCGKTTCASERGKFCAYLGSKVFGTIPICTLFASKDDSYVLLNEHTEGSRKGWLARCPQCLKATGEK